MKRYEEYKKTGLTWLPEIPQNWKWRFLSQVAQEQTIRKPAGEVYPILTLTYGEIKRKKNIDSGLVPADYGTYQMLYKGNIVLRLIDLQNDHTSLRTGIVKETGIITSAYTCIVPTENTTYLHYLLHSYDTKKVFYGYGGGVRQSIGFKDIRYLQVPVPPRDEQDQIVRFLDWKVSGINKLINIRHKEISELNESLNTKLRDVLLSVPNVKEVPLKRICSVPMTDGPHETPTFVDSGIPFVSAEASHDGRIHLDECRGFITREQHEVYCQKVRPHKNDIFIVKSGSTTGKTVMVDFDEEFSIWSPLALVRCNNLAMPRYVFFYCTSVMFQKQVRDNWSFGTQPNIGMGVLENLRLPLPEIEEQRAIVDTLDAYWSKVLQVKCNLKKQIEELQSLKTRIIADAVTGKIDVRSIEIPKYEFVNEDIDNADENLEQGADEPLEEE